MPFFGTGGFATIFQPKGLEKIQNKADAESQKLLSNNEIFSLDARNKDEIVVTVGGLNSNGGVSNFANLSMKNYRDYVEEYYITAANPEVEEAIDIIVNEIVSVDGEEEVLCLDLDGIDASEKVKEIVRERFERLVDVMDFNDTAYESVKDWFISGRQGFYLLTDPKRPKDGVTGALMLDPRCLRPVTSVELDRTSNAGEVDRIKSRERGFIYDPTIIEKSKQNSLAYSYNFSRKTLFLPEKSVVYIDSGEKPDLYGFVPSKIHYSIKPVNNLVTVEDATVIYAITRAPERRAFYLDVGSLGSKAAKTYMEEMMGMFQTELNYDRSSGKVVNNTSTMGIVEDFWLPRREGANATEIQTLDGGQNLGEMRHVYHFQEKVYRSLKIPRGRIDAQGGMVNIGGSDLAEVDREEHRFTKYTNRLGRRYCTMFKEALVRDLELTSTITSAEADVWKKRMKIFFNSDSYVVERQEAETMANRIDNLTRIEPYVGKVISLDTALKQVMRMSEEEIAEERKKIEAEKKTGLYGDQINPLKRDEENGGF